MFSNSFEWVYSQEIIILRNLLVSKGKKIRESSFWTKAPNTTNGINTLYIHCDLISNSIVDGRYNDTIYLVQ